MTYITSPSIEVLSNVIEGMSRVYSNNTVLFIMGEKDTLTQVYDLQTQTTDSLDKSELVLLYNSSNSVNPHSDSFSINVLLADVYNAENEILICMQDPTGVVDVLTYYVSHIDDGYAETNNRSIDVKITLPKIYHNIISKLKGSVPSKYNIELSSEDISRDNVEFIKAVSSHKKHMCFAVPDVTSDNDNKVIATLTYSSLIVSNNI